LFINLKKGGFGMNSRRVEKEEIPISMANRLINNGATILVTTPHPNIVTIAWQMPVSHKPMLVAISLAKGHFSHKLIEDSGEFVINLPNISLLEKVNFCGKVSGREVDKFKETGLTPIPANRVDSPLIEECIGHIECKVVEVVPAGDHTIFIGEVLSASVNKGLFDGHLKVDEEEAKTIHHLGGMRYTTVSGRIEVKV
jgi:flavin reductase (DIM6/NTAB) family NADH-FMN oxidoreductase RutF